MTTSDDRNTISSSRSIRSSALNSMKSVLYNEVSNSNNFALRPSYYIYIMHNLLYYLAVYFMLSF
jgi:hypothetical protein